MFDNKRSEQVMLDLILEIAINDPRIRAVLMNGSRTSPNAKKDIFQDYDIVYLVTDVESFVNDKIWIDQFGERLIMQAPDEMDGHWEKDKNSYAYLMQFTDGNRIDLTLLNLSKWPSTHRDSQSVLLLDKDHIIGVLPLPSDADYLPTPPTAKQFSDCCNEFLWVATYVAKGIWRKELTYAKHTAEQIVKEELIKLLIWHAGIKTNYSKPIGKYGKYLEKYLEPELWQKFTQTYVDADYQHMWDALFIQCELFNQIAKKIAAHFAYVYNEKEYHAVTAFLQDIKNNDGCSKNP